MVMCLGLIKQFVKLYSALESSSCFPFNFFYLKTKLRLDMLRFCEMTSVGCAFIFTLRFNKRTDL